MMIKIIITKILLLSIISGFSQTIKDIMPANHAYHYFIYGDKKHMKLEGNNITYIFKENIRDGLWLGFYDKKFTDTAIVALIDNGLIEKYMFRWDKKGKYIQDIVEYKKGKMDGIRKSYVKINGVMFENIYKYENDARSEMIKIEW